MYAVVRTGGKQYRVAPGDTLEVEKLAGDVGDSVVLEDVLLVVSDDGVKIGQPNVNGASVTAKITGQRRGEKILVFRYRPKKRVRVRRGHRQFLTRLEIQSIRGEDFEFVAEAAVEASAELVKEAVATAVETIPAEDRGGTMASEGVEDDGAAAAAVSHDAGGGAGGGDAEEKEGE